MAIHRFLTSFVNPVGLILQWKNTLKLKPSGLNTAIQWEAIFKLIVSNENACNTKINFCKQWKLRKLSFVPETLFLGFQENHLDVTNPNTETFFMKFEKINPLCGLGTSYLHSRHGNFLQSKARQTYPAQQYWLCLRNEFPFSFSF